jgi:hypothetical protein
MLLTTYLPISINEEIVPVQRKLPQKVKPAPYTGREDASRINI